MTWLREGRGREEGSEWLKGRQALDPEENLLTGAAKYHMLTQKGGEEGAPIETAAVTKLAERGAGLSMERILYSDLHAVLV